MNLRLPVIAAIVTAAVAVAAFRGVHHPSTAPPTAIPAGDVPGASASPLLRQAPPERHARQSVTVYVAGAVVRAGVYTLPASARADDAIRAAGGPAVDADLVAVNLAEPVSDGEEIVLRVKGAPPLVTDSRDAAQPRAHRTRHRKRHKHRKHTSDASTISDSTSAMGDVATSPATVTDGPSQMVDINTAEESELESLPGIGPALASRIVTFREINGAFASADDLLDVNGMTQGRLDAIAPYVTAN